MKQKTLYAIDFKAGKYADSRYYDHSVAGILYEEIDTLNRGESLEVRKILDKWGQVVPWTTVRQALWSVKRKNLIFTSTRKTKENTLIITRV